AEALGFVPHPNLRGLRSITRASDHKALVSAAIAPTATTIMVPSLIVMRYSRSFSSRARSERICSILNSILPQVL
ncbi:MAG: hypothetical protein ACREX9_01645, partial [Gammaproteobacteria bacterium]